jgi:drug/metabolite transporter (DMT)-like permease
MESSPIRDRLMLVGAAALFSTGGAAIKSTALTPWQVASFRSAVAVVVLLAALPEARRGWRWSIVPVAAAYATTMLLFVLANRLTTAADTIFLQSTAPLYLLLLGPLLLHEPIRAGDLLYMAAVLGGIGLFFFGTEAAMASAPDPRRGNVLALASGLTYALMLAGLRWLAQRGHGASGLAASALGNVMAAVAALPLAVPVRSFHAADLGVMLYLGVIQIGLAYVLLTRGIRNVPGVEATTLLMIEPALSPLWAWLLQGERPGGWALTGGAVILGATLANTWRHARLGR